jgi:hypothetical protein
MVAFYIASNCCENIPMTRPPAPGIEKFGLTLDAFEVVGCCDHGCDEQCISSSGSKGSGNNTHCVVLCG